MFHKNNILLVGLDDSGYETIIKTLGLKSEIDSLLIGYLIHKTEVMSTTIYKIPARASDRLRDFSIPYRRVADAFIYLIDDPYENDIKSVCEELNILLNYPELENEIVLILFDQRSYKNDEIDSFVNRFHLDSYNIVYRCSSCNFECYDELIQEIDWIGEHISKKAQD